MRKGMVMPEPTINKRALGLLFREARCNPSFARAMAASEWLQEVVKKFIAKEYWNSCREKDIEATINEFIRLTSLD